MNYNPIICALDTKDLNIAIDLCKKIKPYIGMVKLGLEFFLANGNNGVKAIESLGLPIFLDLKLHDIPNTVAKAIENVVNLNVKFVTIHTLGGRKMLQSASLSARDYSLNNNKKAPEILGVTVLTSMDKEDLEEIGIRKSAKEQVKMLARLAHISGLDGVICSPHEIKIVKEICGSKFKTIVPGIRAEHDAKDDQKRTLTAAEAIKEGADYLVIGRPITASSDPIAAARSIWESIK